MGGLAFVRWSFNANRLLRNRIERLAFYASYLHQTVEGEKAWKYLHLQTIIINSPSSL